MINASRVEIYAETGKDENGDEHLLLMWSDGDPQQRAVYRYQLGIDDDELHALFRRRGEAAGGQSRRSDQCGTTRPPGHENGSASPRQQMAPRPGDPPELLSFLSRAPAAKHGDKFAPSRFDHLVGAGEPQRFRGLKVDGQHVHGRVCTGRSASFSPLRMRAVANRTVRASHAEGRLGASAKPEKC